MVRRPSITLVAVNTRGNQTCDPGLGVAVEQSPHAPELRLDALGTTPVSQGGMPNGVSIADFERTACRTWAWSDRGRRR
jgi:hypothetical protein